MARPVVVGFSAATDGYAYQVEKDTLLVGVLGALLISSSPNSTIANSATAPSTGIHSELILHGKSGFSGNVVFPLSRGEVIYLSCQAAGNFIMLFEDLDS